MTLGANLNLGQSFSLLAEGLTGQLIPKNGSAIPFKVGQDVTITVPDFGGTEGIFNIDAVVDLNAIFSNKTSLGFDVNFAVLAGLLEIDPPFNVPGLKVGPLFDKNLELFKGDLASLYNKSFNLTGFSSRNFSLGIPVASVPGGAGTVPGGTGTIPGGTGTIPGGTGTIPGGTGTIPGGTGTIPGGTGTIPGGTGTIPGGTGTIPGSTGTIPGGTGTIPGGTGTIPGGTGTIPGGTGTIPGGTGTIPGGTGTIPGGTGTIPGGTGTIPGGTGIVPGGTGTVATSVPEPNSSAALLGISIVSLSFVRRRRHRQEVLLFALQQQKV
jgi:hypothetical protein